MPPYYKLSPAFIAGLLDPKKKASPPDPSSAPDLPERDFTPLEEILGERPAPVSPPPSATRPEPQLNLPTIGDVWDRMQAQRGSISGATRAATPSTQDLLPRRPASSWDAIGLREATPNADPNKTLGATRDDSFGTSPHFGMPDGLQFIKGPTTYSTAGGHQFSTLEALKPVQLSTASSIVDYGRAHGFPDNVTQVVLNQAAYESSLGRLTSNSGNSSVTGLFQYDQPTWNQRGHSGVRTSDADQIAAMFRDVGGFSTRYATGLANGAIPKGVTFEQYVETKHHAGSNSTSWDLYKKDYDRKIGRFGLRLVPKKPRKVI